VACRKEQTKLRLAQRQKAKLSGEAASLLSSHQDCMMLAVRMQQACERDNAAADSVLMMWRAAGFGCFTPTPDGLRLSEGAWCKKHPLCSSRLHGDTCRRRMDCVVNGLPEKPDWTRLTALRNRLRSEAKAAQEAAVTAGRQVPGAALEDAAEDEPALEDAAEKTITGFQDLAAEGLGAAVFDCLETDPLLVMDIASLWDLEDGKDAAFNCLTRTQQRLVCTTARQALTGPTKTKRGRAAAKLDLLLLLLLLRPTKTTSFLIGLPCLVNGVTFLAHSELLIGGPSPELEICLETYQK
jgi:hypothetical protein